MPDDCYKCAHRRTIPGDAHTRCERDFQGLKLPRLDPHGVRMGWCFFPFNFDPIWVGPCEGYQKLQDAKDA